MSEKLTCASVSALVLEHRQTRRYAAEENTMAIGDAVMLAQQAAAVEPSPAADFSYIASAVA